MKKNIYLFLCTLTSGGLVSASDHFAPINEYSAFVIEQDARRIQLEQEIQNLEWDLVALQEDINNTLATNSISLGHNSAAFIVSTELQESVNSKYLKIELLDTKTKELAAITAQ